MFYMEGEIQTEQPKSKKWFIWSIIFLVIFGLVLLALTNCTVKNKLGLGLSCHLNKALTENNVSICNELSRNSQVSTCYKEYAITKKDTSVCEDIPDKLEIMNCYKGIAQESENHINLCGVMVWGGVDYGNCHVSFLQVKDNVEECNLLSGFNKDFCYRVFSWLKKDVSLCNSIIDSREKETCIGNAFIDSVSKDTPCADSDSGINQKVKGTVIDNIENAVYTDQCLGASLIEHYCENNRHQQKEIPCSCNEGICP